MAGIRDPAFWKRFSVAVHMDEDQAEKQGHQHKDECVSLIYAVQLGALLPRNTT